jgi:hypothetical protein
MDDDRLEGAIAAVAAASLDAAPPRHPAETDDCPSIPSLATMARRGLEPRVAIHMAGCRRCRVTLGTVWADDTAHGVTGWSRVFAAAAGRLGDTAGTDEEADLAADALLAASGHLRDARLSADLADTLEAACVTVAGVLFDRDAATADELRTLAYELRSATDRPPGGGAETDERLLESLVAGWAEELAGTATVADLRSARALYRSLGDRASAGACSRELAAVLETEGRTDEAQAELAAAALERGFAEREAERPV